MERYLKKQIVKDLKKKIVLISGPRQSGKTTISKSLNLNFDYLNYDNLDHRTIIKNREWDRKKELLILDEIHKMDKWKGWLKGIYDVEGNHPNLLVTGSAKLDTFRKVGDSLAGRYFSFRLHPFDLKELKNVDPNFLLENAFDRLLNQGGFPEPYLEQDPDFYKRWRRTHLDIIIRQDLVSLESVTNINGIENLLLLLRTRVGGTISYANLASDLGVDPKTVKNWLEILERLFVIFKVTPYSKKIRESLQKAPKYFFYDNGQVEGDLGAKLENLVACALLKEMHYLEDIFGKKCALHFLRTKRGHEIDFLVLIDDRPTLMIETKWNEDQLGPHFDYFSKYLPNSRRLTLVGKIGREKTYDHKTEIRSAANWLANSLELDSGLS